MELTRKITEGNRIVIPKSVMDELEIQAGDSVAIKAENGMLCLTPYTARHAQDLVERYATNRPKGSVVDHFLQEKRAEAQRELEE